MALYSAASAFRGVVLQHLRLPALSSSLPAAGVLLPRLADVLVRGFAGGFLDKDLVTERVMHVAKHFEKVDPAKVTLKAHFEKDLGLDSLDIVELVMALEEEFGLEIPDAEVSIIISQTVADMPAFLNCSKGVPEADKIQTIDEAINYVFSNPLSK